MTDRRFIKPAEGVSVPLPGGAGPLPKEGRAVEWSSYWQRRLQDGDVAEAPVPAEKPGTGKGEKA